jgi:hypothetical protein
MQKQLGGRATELGGNTDTGWLKIVALVFMIVDHLGVAVFPGVTEMRILGRIAMPIYAWCLVVGCEYTHDILRYAFRLLVLAVVSQPINMVALSNPWSKLNILFLLCLGVLVIAGIRGRWLFSQFWAPVLAYVFLGFVSVDYGWKGLTFILLLYAARKSAGGILAVVLAFALFWGGSSSQVVSFAGLPLTFLEWTGVGPVLKAFFHLQTLMWLALPWILIPTHRNVRMPKWLGYGLYPLHLLGIIGVLLIMGVPLAQLLAVLGS